MCSLYFVPRAVREAMQVLQASLRPGGYLLVAASEAPLAQDELFERAGHVGLLRHRSLNGQTLGIRPDEGQWALPPTRLGDGAPAGEVAPGPEFPTPWHEAPAPAETEPEAASEEMVRSSPEELGESVREASMHYRAGRYEAAAALLRDPVRAEGAETGRAWVGAVELLARSLSNLGDMARAEAVLRTAVERDKLSPLLRFRLAGVLLELGREEEAVRELRGAIYLDERFVLAHVLLGNTTLRQGRREEGRRHLGNALQLVNGMDGSEPLEGGEGFTAAGLGRLLEDMAAKEDA